VRIRHIALHAALAGAGGVALLAVTALPAAAAQAMPPPPPDPADAVHRTEAVPPDEIPGAAAAAAEPTEATGTAAEVAEMAGDDGFAEDLDLGDVPGIPGMPVLDDIPGLDDAPGLPGIHGSPAAAAEGSVKAKELLAKVSKCKQISKGKYRTDQRASASVPVCDAGDAVFWKADMDIDCDGRRTTHCNSRTDPSFQPATAFQQSDGAHLNAEKLPFIVVPTPGNIWNYKSSGIRGGSVAAVVYGGKVRYAVVGDTGPTQIIGEASYAAAKALGIDPNPAKGGTASGVTYIVFKNSKVSPIESHGAAVKLGESLARNFVEGDR
jgi:hypothetical protein